MSEFLQNSWYVFGWEADLAEANPLGRVLLDQPIVIWRDSAGNLHAMEDRCPHRHAPLSMGRIEGDHLRCMYHGMMFDQTGVCVGAPLLDSAPKLALKTYPVIAKNSWLWVWMGAPHAADPDLIPTAFGVDDPEQPMRFNSIEYDAHYQLIHDNLCDLSHVDFVHSTTLRPATGANWSVDAPRVRQTSHGIKIERWFAGAQMPGDPEKRVDVWSSYDFYVPGIFVMRSARYEAGAAAACDFGEPSPDQIPLVRNMEQQAVTPISARRTAYHFATGLVGATPAATKRLAERMDVVLATFDEDRKIIEAQQRIWDLTDPDTPKQFLPQDKAPHMMRQLMRRLIESEQQGGK